MSVGPVHHVVLNVHDLDRTVAFYRDLLGFRVTLRGEFADAEHEISFRLAKGSGGRTATVQPKGGRAGLIELVEWTIPGGVQPTGRKQAGDVPGVWALAFELLDEELPPFYARLRDAGVEFYSDAVSTEIENYGKIEWIACEDPDGMLLEFIVLPKKDRHQVRAPEK